MIVLIRWMVVALLSASGATGVMSSTTMIPSSFVRVIPAFSGENDEATESKSSSVRFPNPETERLEIYVGAWSVTERHYDAAGKESNPVKGGEDIVWVLDHHAVGRTYTRSASSSLFRATATVKWIPSQNAYWAAWLSNDPLTGPIQAVGTWNDNEKTMIWNTVVDAGLSTEKRYKVVEKFLDGERREATTFEVEGAKVTKMSLVEYKRTVPCPSKIRTFFGG